MNDKSPYKQFLDTIKLYNYTSQFGEDALIEGILNKIGIKNKWCLECGAADGLFFSNTRRLIEQGWSSIQIEANEDQYNSLRELYGKNESIHCINEMVGLDKGRRLDDILERCEAPKDIDLVVIDVDGQDFWLWNSLVHYRPRLISVEYNPRNETRKLPLPNSDSPLQAGFESICWVAAAKGYAVVCATQTNIIAIPNELSSEHFNHTLGIFGEF